MDAKKSLVEIEHNAVFKDLKELLPKPWGAVLAAFTSGSIRCGLTTVVAFLAAAWVGNGLAANGAPVCATLLGLVIVAAALWLTPTGELRNAATTAIRSNASPQLGTLRASPEST